eukprot:TRINITY_DN8486_c0_g1_i1.p1 TRINITY_DN8486_c0_g1~~TRINITY_DN8486_c0_g1_i1.p1  ORF type:complete len:411 (+),score=110.11 TRINITY_DN8486_c0_g1_i1:37-1269(+)
MSDKKIPVGVITGFLGSGKTTLLQHILHDKNHGKRIAVIENEFGTQLGVHNEVDSHALDNAACVAEIFETSNGCICCGGGGDFIKILYKLIERKNSVDYVIVETTGLADPTFTQQFFIQDDLKEHFYLDGIVTLVDALNVSSHLSRKASSRSDGIEVVNEAVEQIAVADKIVINKTDLVDSETLNRLESQIREINSFAEIIKTEYSKVDVDAVLDIKSFDIERILKRDPGFLEFRPYRQHDDSVTGLSLTGEGEIDLNAFKSWLEDLLKKRGNELYRCKGVLNIKGKPNRFVLQGVHSNYNLQEHLPWDKENRQNKIVLIGKNLRSDSSSIIQSLRDSVGVHFVGKFASESSGGEAPSTMRYVVLLLALLAAIYPNQTKEMMSSKVGMGILFLMCAQLIYTKLIFKPVKQ